MIKNKKTKGKLIVIDGTDGSGKTTQFLLLVDHLKKDGYKVKTVDFPVYYKNFFGKFIGHCLSEQYYNWLNVHPKIASMAYAADRWESSKEMKEWLTKGYIIIANRYVSANQIHQGGKIKNTKKRNDFIKWLDQMEHEVFGIPRPDLTFYLNLPIKIVLELIKKRDSSKMHREYLKNKKDLAENDVDYQENSIKSAVWLSKNIKNFVKVECYKNNEILSREQIHEMIYEKVKKVLR